MVPLIMFSCHFFHNTNIIANVQCKQNLNPAKFSWISPFLPPATKLGQGYVFKHVFDSVHRGVLPQCMLGYPQEQTPRADIPQEQCMLGDMGNKWVVRILLECILVSFTLTSKHSIR